MSTCGLCLLMVLALVLNRTVAGFSWQFLGSQQHRVSFVSLTACNMANQQSSDACSGSSTRTLKLLALHGSEGNGREFTERLVPLKKSLYQQHGIELKITSLTAPYSKGSGYAWWTMNPGERSFNADKYIGFETSENMVMKALQEEEPHVVLAHSQGAILISALLALNRISNHPELGYILNGVAWPNPYTKQLLTLSTPCPTRVAFVMGEADNINPPSSAKQVLSALQKAGFDVSTVKHPGGHSVPTRNKEAVQALSEWIAQ